MTITNPDEEDARMSEDDVEEEEEEEEVEEEEACSSEQQRAYLPNSDPQPGPDEELVMDCTAYKLYYQLSVESPCLSMDVLADPHNAAGGAGFNFDNADAQLSCFFVCGTQAKDVARNALCVMRASCLYPMRHKSQDEADDDDNDDDDDDDDEEELERRGEVTVAQVRHNRTVNRLRAAEVQGRPLAATLSECGAVYVFDLADPLAAVGDHRLLTEFVRRQESPQQQQAPLFSFHGHKVEGFGIDWCHLLPGRMATGDTSGCVHVWHPAEGAAWRVEQRSLQGHCESVEDLQWSPSEASVLASCSVDRSVRIFDVRARPDKACMLTCADSHESDVNVIAWNRAESQYLLSGGDDAALRVWDLRSFGSSCSPACSFSYHTRPITSVQWHPTDSSVFLASSEDNQLTLWDLACERDQEEQQQQQLPPQLMFIHCGQEEIKEGHWHPQLPGLILSTAQDGINIFKTISI